jgi:hypothetical protein
MEKQRSEQERLYPLGGRHELAYRQSLLSLGLPLATYPLEHIVSALEEYCTPEMADVVLRYLLGQGPMDIVAQTDLLSTDDVNEMVIHSTYKITEGFSKTLDRTNASLSLPQR